MMTSVCVIFVIPSVGPTNDGMIRPYGEATVQNLNIDGNNKRTNKNKALRGIYSTSNLTDLTVENVNITGTGYALNIQGKGLINLSVKNSTFEGWTSYASAVNAKFDNVSFTRGNYFTKADQNGYFRPYGNTTLENCKFELGFIVDFSELKGTEKITIKNCEYNNVKLTAENIPAIWATYAEKAEFVVFE